jgi:putative transcriptional regulator
VSYGNELRASLEEALEIAQGTKKPACIDRVSFTPPPDYVAEELKQIRKQLRMTQVGFANLLGVSSKTVEAWEAGTNQPSGAAARAIQIFASHPELAGEFTSSKRASV